MEREGVLERDVEIAAPPRVVWGVESITEIAAYHHHAYVDAQADTRAERDVAQERLAFKLAAGTQRVVLEQPDVARVNERRAMKDADDREPILRVELELERTRLVEISVFL